MEINPTNILAEAAIKETIDAAVNGLKKLIQKKRKKDKDQDELFGQISFTEDSEILEGRLYDLVKTSMQWAEGIRLKESTESRTLSEVFIDLDVYLSQRRHNYTNNQRTMYNKVMKYRNKSTIIYGNPGAGKTTLMKKIFMTEMQSTKKRFTTPLVFRFRDAFGYNTLKDTSKTTLFHLLSNFFGLRIAPFSPVIGKSSKRKDSQNLFDPLKEYQMIIRELVLKYIDELNMLLILDGFDELPFPDSKSTVADDIDFLTRNLKLSRIIVTSRTGELDFRFEQCDTFEIASLSEKQIKKFISKWIRDRKIEDDFFKKLSELPFYDTAILPLNLAHLCIIYQNDLELPDKPAVVYERIFELSLDEWNKQNRLNRLSKYSDFDRRRKLRFLRKFAYLLTTDTGKSTFSKREMADNYRRIARDFGLPLEECLEVLIEIESHHGIILQTGHDSYEFAHKSLQEFLTASYLVNKGRMVERAETLLKIPNEVSIAVALNSEPNMYIYEIVNKVERSVDGVFINPFLKRLNIERPDYSDDISLLFAIYRLYRAVLRNIPKSTARDASENRRVTLENIYDFLQNILYNANISQTKDRMRKAYRKHLQSKSMRDDGFSGDVLKYVLVDNAHSPDDSVRFPQDLLMDSRLALILFESTD